MSKTPTDLPDGWRQVQLGDVLQLHNGRAFKTSEWSTKGRPIIRIQNLKSADSKYNYYEGDLPERYRAANGDLLFAWSGTPGTSFGAHIWSGGDAWVNQHIFRVEFSEELFDRRFLKFALNNNVGGYIEQAQGGVGLAHITKKKLNASMLPVPPLDEQRRIVDRLEAIDALQSTSTARLNRVSGLLKGFRQAIFTSAYEDAVSAATGLNSLGELLREPLKNGYSARPVNVPTAYKVLTLSATTSGFFDASQFKYTEEAFPADSELWLQAGDIVVQRGNTPEYVGTPGLYEGPPNEFIYPDLMIRVRLAEHVDTRFAWYMMLAPASREYLQQRATGSAGNMPKINQTTLSRLPLPVPSLERQTEIVHRVDALLDRSDAISAQVADSTQRLAYTSRTALAKAFRGDFVG